MDNLLLQIGLAILGARRAWMIKIRSLLALLCCCTCRAPRLLLVPGPQLSTNFKGAQATLQIDAGSVADMLASEPRLLQLDPLVFRARVDGMMSQLYLPRKQVRWMS